MDKFSLILGNKFFYLYNIKKIFEPIKYNKWLKHWLLNELKQYNEIIKNINIRNIQNSRSFIEYYNANIKYKNGLNLENYNDLIKFNKSGIQIYDNEFSIANTYYVNLIWNIESAKKIIKNQSLDVKVENISEYAQFYKEKEVYTDYANKSNLSEPLIFVECPIVEAGKILIDGNHRFYRALKNGNRNIKYYLLSVEQSLESMLCEEVRTLYKLYNNILRLHWFFNLNEGILEYSNDSLFNLSQNAIPIPSNSKYKAANF